MSSISENTWEYTLEDTFMSELSEIGEQVDASDNNDDLLESHYDSLISMFPNVDSENIREILINPPFNVTEDDDLLVMSINHLTGYNEHVDENYMSTVENLDVVDSKETTDDQVFSEMVQLQELQIMEMEKENEELLNNQLFSEFLQQDQEVINEKLNILISILPDADPEYLRQFIERNEDNMSLEQFIEQCFIDKSYKKRNDHYAKRQAKQRIEQYTTNFSVENFIKQFPEPFEHFESNYRQGMYQERAFNFLKRRYNSFEEEYLKNIYSSNKFNLSLTDKEIQFTNSSVTPVPVNFNTDDILLLQEIAFIQNRDFVKVYLDNVKQKEEEELQILRSQNLLLECPCCYNELKPTECIECDGNHIFCRSCVIRGTNAAISNGQTKVECFVECDKEINLNVLRKVLPEGTFEMLLKKRQEAEIEAAQLEGLVTCPFCPYQMELGPQIQIFTCKNPECMKITCRWCKKINHLPITRCEDVIDDHKGRLFVEEEMSKALIRNCFKCQKPFVKDSGCNKMTCYCGAMMCYICRSPITGYEHFDKAGGCQTNQNSEVFDREQIELRRIQATSQLRQDFPDINVPETF